MSLGSAAPGSPAQHVGARREPSPQPTRTGGADAHDARPVDGKSDVEGTFAHF